MKPQPKAPSAQATKKIAWDCVVKSAPLQGLLLLAKIAAQRGSGLLTVERDALKKQIGFVEGSPVIVRSNDPEDSFLRFLSVEKVLSLEQLKTIVKDYEVLQPKPDIRVYLIQAAGMDGARMAELQNLYSIYRLLQTTPQLLGRWSFQELDKCHSFGSDLMTWPTPFGAHLMEKLRSLKDSLFMGHESLRREGSAKVTVDQFYFPLKDEEEKAFQEMKVKIKSPSTLQGLKLKLLLLLQIGGGLEWKNEEAEEVYEAAEPHILEKELLNLRAMAPKKRYHEILGLGLIETDDKIRSTFNRLIRRFHPDRMPTPELRKLAEATFPIINLAYDTMIHPGKRAEFIAAMELEQMGGVEALQKRVEAEMQIPHAQQLLRKRHFKHALELLDSIREVMPTDGEILADRVYAEMMWMIETKQNLKGEIGRLRQWINQALENRATYASGYYYRGMLSKMDGQLEQAVKDFDRAIAIDPNHSEAQSEARVLRMRIQKKV